ncbi:MAG: hypothetical protein Q9167_003364 [Letrouitia subvulpina]
MSFVNVDGSIACTLQVCQQTLVKLYNHLEHSFQDADHSSELPRCSDTIGRLSMWDSETGAGFGRLDHGLRKSSMLREGTEELLQELATISDEGKRCKNVTHLFINFKIALSLVQRVNQDGADDDSKAHECSAATNVDDSTSSEPGSNLSLSSTDTSSPLHQKITEMHDILDCLLRQVPALQDPAPHDTRTKDDYEGVYSVDLSHLKSKYPKASQDLLNRLAVTNWKRRQQLMSLRARNEEEEIAVEPALNIGNSATSEDNDSDTTSEAEAEASQYSRVNSTGLQSQLTGEWTAFSGNGSTMGTAITSMSGDPPLKMPNLDQPVERVDAHRLRLPRPPKPNSMLEGKQFRCPYCSFELMEVATLATWK